MKVNGKRQRRGQTKRSQKRDKKPKIHYCTGGVNAAAGGTLTFMVGADTGETFTRAEAVLGDMGAKIVHCGAVGTGGAVKICNNMLLAVSQSFVIKLF